jgi:hypothetical protein
MCDSADIKLAALLPCEGVAGQDCTAVLAFNPWCVTGCAVTAFAAN